MAKTKLAFQVPDGSQAVDTLVVGGSAAVGFLGGNLLRNKVPKTNSKAAKVIIAVLALGAHASIEGDGHDANALRGASLGIGLNQLTSLADEAGSLVMAKRDQGIIQGASATLNGGLDIAAAMLTENYIPAGGRQQMPIEEERILIEEHVPNGPYDASDMMALNNLETMGNPLG